MKIKIENLINDFKKFNNWEDRYRFLIELGKALPMMNEANRVEANLIKGCQSQVWLHAELVDQKIQFSGDSDASIVKGIVAILIKVYSNSTPDEILMTKALFLEEIGLKEHLSMSRANGLNAMIKQINFYAMAYKIKLKQEEKS